MLAPAASRPTWESSRAAKDSAVEVISPCPLPLYGPNARALLPLGVLNTSESRRLTVPFAIGRIALIAPSSPSLPTG